MALLNADIPPIYCKVRKEYLYDFKKHQGESDECVIFGLTSMAGAATLFNIMLPNGAVFFRLPIAAFFQKHLDREQVRDMQVDELQLWNSFSYYPSVHMFNYLTSQRGKYFGKDKKEHFGEYLFTIDWCHPESNILKMSKGQALNDNDRLGWLQTLNRLAIEQSKNNSCVIVCSALKKSYRDILNNGIENHTKWVFLQGAFVLFYLVFFVLFHRLTGICGARFLTT